jgi:predicted Abi (CAAX) family protease
MSKIIASTSSLVSVIRSALTTLPSLRGWLETGLVFAIFLCVAGYIGLHADLFKVQLTDAWLQFAIIALVAIVVPALAEEMIFRVSLPHLLGGHSWSEALALLFFVLWHPLQVWLSLPMGQALFLEPAFLTAVFLLGLSCALVWKRTSSIWPAIAIHWVTVLAWKGLTTLT